MQNARERDVVQVVAGRLGQRARLPEARHAAIDQAGVEGVAVIGAEPELFSDARAQTFQQHVGAGDQAQRGVAAGGQLQIQRHRTAAA